MSVSVATAPPLRARRPITWDAAVQLYVTHLKAARRAEGTVDGYTKAIQMLRDYLGSTVACPADVTVQQLREYQCGLLTGKTARRGKPLSVSSISRMVTVFSGFFSFLVAEEKLAKDPTLKLEQPKKAQPAPADVLTVKEVEKLLAAPDTSTPKGLRNKALVELYYATGLRLNEALDLDLTDLNHQEREVTVRHGKGDKGRVVPVTRSAWNHLMDYLDRARPVLAAKNPAGTGAVFLSTLGQRMCQNSVGKLVHALRIAAGIKKKLTPHCLRRSFATHLMNNRVNIRVIQTLLGHTSLNTTAVYLRLDASELRRLILLNHPRERINP